MAVRLKFRCHEVRKNAGTKDSGEKTEQGFTKYVPCEVGGVKLAPIMGSDDAENKAFYQATPGGQIDFSTINEEALKQFEIGADYYITIERAG